MHTPLFPGLDNPLIATWPYEVGCELDRQYPVDGHPDFYFVVRSDKFDRSEALERVCLYERDVVNFYRNGHDAPADLWHTNELLGGRKLEKLHEHMREKVESMVGRRAHKQIQQPF